MPDSASGASGLVVELAGARWAVPLSGVVEVLREARVIRVPGGVPAVHGMVNHRGKIVTVASGSRVLDLPGEPRPGGDIVIVQWQQRRFGIAVDAVIELGSEARTGLAEINLEQIALAIFA